MTDDNTTQNSENERSFGERFVMALAGAILIGGAVIWLLIALLKVTSSVMGWLIGIGVGLLAFYLIFKSIKTKVHEKVEEHREEKERKEQRAQVQQDLADMESTNPSASTTSTTSSDGTTS